MAIWCTTDDFSTAFSRECGQIYIDMANALVDATVDYDYVEELAASNKTEALTRLKSAGLLLANALQSNPTLLKSSSIGKGAISASYQTIQELNEAASVLIQAYARGGVQFDDLVREY